MSYRVRQITKESIKSKEQETQSISVPVRYYNQDTQEYDIKMENEQVPYAVAVEGKDIIKFGYCCEPKAILYPIYVYLYSNQQYKWISIKLPNTGMYEMQPETVTGIDTTEEEEIFSPKIKAIKVPAEVDFTLEYCY